MDVPGKWGLDEFLDLAAAVLKQHGFSRRGHDDGFQSTPVGGGVDRDVTWVDASVLCRKGTRIADSLRPHFEMQLGTAPRPRVLEAIETRYQAVLVKECAECVAV